MNVVLIAPPTPNPSPNYFGPPMGLALLGALLRRDGHTPRGYDWDRSTVDAMLADVPRMLAEDRPDLVGISCLSITRGASYGLARRVRELAPDLPIVFGGPYPTLAPEEVLARTPADFVCVGDGEETLPQLVAALAAGRDASTVAGLATRNGRTAPRADFKDLDSLPYPDLDMFGVAELLARYARPHRAALWEGLRSKGRRPYVSDSALMVLGSRGCVWRCDFCPMSKFEGRTRMHSPAYLVDYIEHLVKRYGHRHLVFGDNTLTWWREHSVELFERMIERDLGVEWICMTRADLVDPEILALMERAGCREISFGIESGSEAVHKTIKKKLRLHKVRDAFRMTHEAGINSTCMLMVGNRGETPETLRDTTGLVRDLDPDRILIWTTKVYPGTVLFDVAREQGVIPTNWVEDESAPAPYYTGEHSLDELKRMEAMLQHRTTWVDARGSIEAVDRDLRLSTWRSQGGTILGGPGAEPFARADLGDILARSRRHETKSLMLLTDARALASARVAEAAHMSNAIRGILVPLWSMRDRHHDGRVGTPGALLETRKGLLRWTKDGAFVRAFAMMDKFGLSDARAWVRWLKEHRVTEAVLTYGETPAGWHRLPATELPPPAAAAQVLAAAAEEARAVGLDLAVTGVPRCLVPDGTALYEQARPFDEAVDADGEPYNLSIRRRVAKKQFVAACDGCALRGQCEGLWTDVVRVHGEAGLAPALRDDEPQLSTSVSGDDGAAGLRTARPRDVNRSSIT